MDYIHTLHPFATTSSRKTIGGCVIMRKLDEKAVVIFATVVIMFLFELMFPAAKGLTIGMLSVFWALIKGFFLQDAVLSIILFIVGSLSLYGTLRISRKQENKIWSIASAIVAIISYIAMLTCCSSNE